MCTFVGALVIVIIGVSTNSPAIAIGVFGGVVAATFTFVVSFKARAALRRDLGKSNQHRNRLNYYALQLGHTFSLQLISLQSEIVDVGSTT
jgi:hypothetical protein